MRIPRDLSAQDLIHALRRFGYAVTRQRGSHIRLETQEHGPHHITIPNHAPLRLGTAAGILADVADHLGITREQLVERLFAGK